MARYDSTGMFAGLSSGTPPYGFPDALFVDTVTDDDLGWLGDCDEFLPRLAAAQAEEAKKPAPPQEFASIDPGFKNTGLCMGEAQWTEVADKQVELTLRITRLVNLAMCEQRAFSDAEELFRKVRSWVQTNLETPWTPKIVLIEKQYFSPRGALTAVSHNLKMLETVLYTACRLMFNQADLVDAVDPKHVKKHWNTQGGDNALNKKLALQAVQELFGTLPRTITHHEADAVLQAAYWFVHHRQLAGEKVVKMRLVFNSA